ncbi:MAG TPA: ABC-2 transporter permease [Gammaproteobacteria bacterium]|jgi:ABC-2 type transport system permease protein|nr:ABC-2 transporter permease [Gammaproteobacteria bacterium]
MNAVDMRINKTLIRREFWENRSLWLVPMVFAAILTVLSVYMLVAVLVNHSGAVNNIDIDNGPHFQISDMPDLRDASDAEINGFVRVVTFSLSFMFSRLMLIVTFFYLLDSLYADRRDRSVLFWRSMPVSDTRTVLSKLATAVIGVTVVAFAVTVAFELVLLVLGLILGAALGTHPFVLLAHPGAFLSSWLLVAWGELVQALWYLPIFAWVMLASSWAKKTPFLWTVLVPVGIIVAEAWVFHTGYFARMVAHQTVDWLPLAYNFEPLAMKSSHSFAEVGGELFGIGNIGKVLAAPRLWIGAAVAAVFIYGAIELRRKRSEI